MTPQLTAWLILIFGYLIPLAHIGLSPAAGPWRPPQGTRCPFGPRVGWLVLVVLIGPFGWLLFFASRLRLRRQAKQRGDRDQRLNSASAPER